ncbi:unnamed protein product [Heligmosomoides polygyrus]|uniref:Transposase n=1 Tax=Heligmosomoides polygyrus TaxID=6339 RepID=A0A183GG68_HELPZ|nr:unnamed protein product [Heligmosomoides polygyrus]
MVVRKELPTLQQVRSDIRKADEHIRRMKQEMEAALKENGTTYTDRQRELSDEKNKTLRNAVRTAHPPTKGAAFGSTTKSAVTTAPLHTGVVTLPTTAYKRNGHQDPDALRHLTGREYIDS